MHKEDYKDIFFKAFLLFLMILAISLGINDYFDFGIKLIHLMLYDAVLIIIVIILYCFPLVLGWGIILFIAVSIYMKYHHSLMFNRILSDILLFLQWLPAYIAGYAAFLKEYAVPFLIIIMIFATGLLGILVFSRINKLIITAIGIMLFSFFWFTYVEKSHLYLMIFLYSSLLLHSYSLWEKKKEEWKSKSIPVSISFYKSWLSSAALLIGLSIVLMLMLPLNIKPLKIDILNDFMVRNFPFITQWKNASEENYGYSYSFSLAGNVYKDKKLGGPVNFNGSSMLTVKGSLRNNLYLRGSVYDKYSGFNWSRSRRKSFIFDEKKVLDMLANIEFMDLNIEIKPERLISSTLFSALYPVNVKLDNEKIFINDDLEMYTSKIIDKNSSYNINIKLPMISEDMLREAMADADKEISNTYLKLPNNIPDRLSKLVEHITYGKNNSYDMVKAIEAYLRSNYQYTLEPENVPAGRDFVDYFLFEGKEGYCTYFASSMVVMLRLAGIPARYVEGFLVEPKGDVENGKYDIIDRNAHAWVEAYFGEYGWITFEPTPAYKEIEPWKKENEEEPQEASNDEEDELVSFSENIIDTTRRKDLMEDEIYTVVDITNGDRKIGINTKHIVYFIIFVILLRILYGLIKINMLKFIKIKDSNKYAKFYIDHIIWLAHKAGRKKKDSETLRQFMSNMNEYFLIEEDISGHIISILEGIIYGGKSITSDEVIKLNEFERRLKREIKANLGEVKYIWNFYLGKP